VRLLGPRAGLAAAVRVRLDARRSAVGRAARSGAPARLGVARPRLALAPPGVAKARPAGIAWSAVGPEATGARRRVPARMTGGAPVPRPEVRSDGAPASVLARREGQPVIAARATVPRAGAAPRLTGAVPARQAMRAGARVRPPRPRAPAMARDAGRAAERRIGRARPGRPRASAARPGRRRSGRSRRRGPRGRAGPPRGRRRRRCRGRAGCRSRRRRSSQRLLDRIDDGAADAPRGVLGAGGTRRREERARRDRACAALLVDRDRIGGADHRLALARL